MMSQFVKSSIFKGSVLVEVAEPLFIHGINVEDLVPLAVFNDIFG